MAPGPEMTPGERPRPDPERTKAGRRRDGQRQARGAGASRAAASGDAALAMTAPVKSWPAAEAGSAVVMASSSSSGLEESGSSSRLVLLVPPGSCHRPSGQRRAAAQWSNGRAATQHVVPSSTWTEGLEAVSSEERRNRTRYGRCRRRRRGTREGTRAASGGLGSQSEMVKKRAASYVWAQPISPRGFSWGDLVWYRSLAAAWQSSSTTRSLPEAQAARRKLVTGLVSCSRCCRFRWKIYLKVVRIDRLESRAVLPRPLGMRAVARSESTAEW